LSLVQYTPQTKVPTGNGGQLQMAGKKGRRRLELIKMMETDED